MAIPPAVCSDKYAKVMGLIRKRQQSENPKGFSSSMSEGTLVRLSGGHDEVVEAALEEVLDTAVR